MNLLLTFTLYSKPIFCFCFFLDTYFNFYINVKENTKINDHSKMFKNSKTQISQCVRFRFPNKFQDDVVFAKF